MNGRRGSREGRGGAVIPWHPLGTGARPGAGAQGNEAGVVPALVEPQPSGEDRTQMGQQYQERREWAGGSTLQMQMDVGLT